MTQRIQIGAVFIIIHLSICYLIYPDLVYSLSKIAHWQVVLCQAFFQLAILWIYIKGLNYFPDSDVIDIYIKMGKWVAIIILIPFVTNLTALVALNIRLHTEVINSIFLPRTPYWSIMMLLFFISVYTAVKGLGTILRSSIFIFLIAIPLVIFNIFSSVVNFDLHNVTFGWNSPPKFLLDKQFYYLLGFSLYLFLGFMTSKTKITFHHLFWAWVTVLLFSLSIVYIPLFIFGRETVVMLPHPFLEAMDSIDISWFSFNRQTVFFGVSLVGLVVLANAVILWIIGRIMHKLFKSRIVKSSYWIIAFSVIAFVFALYIPNIALIEKWFLWSIIAQFYSILVIPFTIFIYGFLSKRGVVGVEKK